MLFTTRQKQVGRWQKKLFIYKSFFQKKAQISYLLLNYNMLNVPTQANFNKVKKSNIWHNIT